MKLLSPTLGRNGDTLAYWCPGCEELHQACAIRWHWNGDPIAPTLSPSVLHFTTDPDGSNRKTLCHYFIKAGQIEFCDDCPHALAGKTVPLPDLPDYWGGYFRGEQSCQ